MNMFIIKKSISTHLTKTLFAVSTIVALGITPNLVSASDIGGPRTMSPLAKPADYKEKIFSPDPTYENKPYSVKEQIDIYGNKKPVYRVDPLIELFRPIYQAGPFEQGDESLGSKNLIFPGLTVFGDWRTAVAYNDNGGGEIGQIATRLNLDIDLKITGTERIHAFIRPIDRGGEFTKYEFSGGDADNEKFILDGNIETLFFEGDIGSIWSGISDSHATFDWPIAFGLTPLLFQNGVWLEDAFVGGATTLAAKSSPLLDITNMDITVFAGINKVTTPAIKEKDGALNDDDLRIFGITTFIDRMEAYWEAGYGVIDGDDEFDDLGYHSLTLAHTKRYGGWLSNSLRAVWTFGQDPSNNTQQTADGIMLIAENSLITSLPSTFVPYFNVWAGFDRPQPLADDTGLLKNVGINFETDGLTGFPKLDDTGHDTFGGAIGISYLFNLDRQLVIEAATVQIMGSDNEVGRAAINDQYALGVRYQHPITPAWIVRADAMYGLLKDADDISGARIEFRRKF
jgi:hypothetical protein